MSGVGRLKFKQNILFWFVLRLLTDILICYLLAGLTLNVRNFRLLHTDVGLEDGFGVYRLVLTILKDEEGKVSDSLYMRQGGLCYEEHVDEC